MNQGTLSWDWSNCIGGMVQEAVCLSKEGLFKIYVFLSEDGRSFHPNNLILKEFSTLYCLVSIQVTSGNSLPFYPVVVSSVYCFGTVRKLLCRFATALSCGNASDHIA